jgi:adenylate cyclase
MTLVILSVGSSPSEDVLKLVDDNIYQTGLISDSLNLVANEAFNLETLQFSRIYPLLQKAASDSTLKLALLLPDNFTRADLERLIARENRLPSPLAVGLTNFAFVDAKLVEQAKLKNIYLALASYDIVSNEDSVRELFVRKVNDTCLPRLEVYMWADQVQSNAADVSYGCNGERITAANVEFDVEQSFVYYENNFPILSLENAISVASSPDLGSRRGNLFETELQLNIVHLLLTGTDSDSQKIGSYLINNANSGFDEIFQSQIILLVNILAAVTLASLLLVLFGTFKYFWINIAILAVSTTINIYITTYNIFPNAVWPFLQVQTIIIITFFTTNLPRLIAERRQKVLIQEMFGQFVNRDLLKMISKNPKAIEIGGAQKELSILFSDVKGFTAMAERLTPKELVMIINKYLSAMSEAIFEYEGTIDKYIGDAVMAFWNAPFNSENHAGLSVYAALRMHDKLNELKKKDAKFKDFEMGIGINTGEVIVGNMGSKYRADYTVLGDSVNLASRLEGLTRKYLCTIIISEDTFRSFSHPTTLKKGGMMSRLQNKNEKQDLLFRKLDKVRVKGRDKPLEIYEPMLVNDRNLQIKASYEKGLDLYQSGDFEQALVELQNIADQDPAAVMLIDRIKETDGERSTDWDGVWKWDQK